jgi:hypothetical protein
VQAETNGGVSRQYIDEGQIRLRVGAFKNVTEITDRLMSMNQESELEFRHQ